jgi:hypothetical protein
MSWLWGLDLGQAQDFTAFSAIEKRKREEDKKNLYIVSFLHRFELGRRYPTMIEKVGEFVSQDPLKSCRMAKELQNFKVKITTAANETFGAWGDGQHDDPILSVALAIWLAEHTGEGNPAKIILSSNREEGGGLLVDSAPQGVFIDPFPSENIFR